MVFGVALQVFGQLPDPARQQRDLYIGAAGVLPVQLELLDVQRFRTLSHFEAPIVNEDCAFARARSDGDVLPVGALIATTAGWRDLTGRGQALPAAHSMLARDHFQ